jgi:hypothetical protein
MECRLWRLFRCAPHVEMRVPCAQVCCNAMVSEQRCCCCQEEEPSSARRATFDRWGRRLARVLGLSALELSAFEAAPSDVQRAHCSPHCILGRHCGRILTLVPPPAPNAPFLSRRTRNQHGTTNAILTTTSASKGRYPREWHSQSKPYPRPQRESTGRRSRPRWS